MGNSILRILKNKFAVTGLVFLTVSFVFLAVYNVPKSITATDILYIDKILEEASYAPQALRKDQKSFTQQVEAIRAVQKSAFLTTPIDKAITAGTPREPENLYNSPHAYCFDRARYMDKALRYLGFEARYAALFGHEDGFSMLQTLTTPSSETRAESHALVEVKTDDGWMAVDTRSLWIGLTKDGKPVSLHQLQEKGYDGFAWPEPRIAEPWPLLKNDFYIIYGLYSRHGQFYPPYTKYIPDINWGEFIIDNING